MTIRRASTSDSKALSLLIMEAAQTVRFNDFNDKGWKLLQEKNTEEAFIRVLNLMTILP